MNYYLFILFNYWYISNTFCSLGKLLSRSQKIAYTLLNRNFSKGETVLKTGDRVALIYPNNDPINFMCAFYGCLQAGMVPVPIEVPITRRVCALCISYFLDNYICFLFF